MSLFVCSSVYVFFFFKQKTAYEMRISDWSSDVCSSDLLLQGGQGQDTLAGGQGDDLLLGGQGGDAFVFSGGGGQDVVLDFQPGEDTLHIARNVNGLDIADPADLADRISSVAGNAVIDLGNGDTITLVNADAPPEEPRVGKACVRTFNTRGSPI